MFDIIMLDICVSNIVQLTTTNAIGEWLAERLQSLTNDSYDKTKNGKD